DGFEAIEEALRRYQERRREERRRKEQEEEEQCQREMEEQEFRAAQRRQRMVRERESYMVQDEEREFEEIEQMLGRWMGRCVVCLAEEDGEKKEASPRLFWAWGWMVRRMEIR